MQKSRQECINELANVMAAVLDINERIWQKLRSCTETRFNDSELKLMLITCELIFLELKRRYSVFLGLTDNLLATNQEKTSLMQDSIIDMADDACSKKNEIHIWVLSV